MAEDGGDLPGHNKEKKMSKPKNELAVIWNLKRDFNTGIQVNTTQTAYKGVEIPYTKSKAAARDL